MRIQHNIPAMSSYRNYSRNVSAVNKNLEKLSSGYKINRAGDDAAGLAISEKMRLQISGLEQAQNNAKSGINLVQTAEGALTEVHDMLNRMYTLAEQSANGTYSNEVDREQLQKEVESLRTEINRIADATNYNGINLLNGKLGLNEEAFEISVGGAAATAATDGSVTLSLDHFHVEGTASTEVKPTATLDLGDLKATVAAGAKGKLTINAFGESFEVELDNSGDTANAKEFTTAEIATALVDVMKTSSIGVDKTTGKAATGGGDNDALLIGGCVFELPTAGASMALGTFAGYMDGTTFKATATDKLTPEAATAVNTALGAAVSFTKGENVTKTSGDVIHANTNVTYAEGEATATKAGVDIKLSADMIKDGATLTIDNQTFVFKVGADGKGGTGTEIDLSACEEGDETLLHRAVDALSKQPQFNGQETRTWKISSMGPDTIHIDETHGSTSGKELKTNNDISALISAKGVAAAAKGAGTTIKVTDAKVKEGDTLKINGKTYTFSDKKTGDGYVAIAGGAADNLVKALAGDKAITAENKNGTVTIRSADVEGSAPSVAGKGLTLQIGDTADDFNKMTVEVKDMHAVSMGIGDIDISTQEGASAAMKKIQNATNYVSDARGDLGALQNRLDHTINNLSVTQENIQDAESTIRDVDIAKEMMAYTKNNILVQSAQAMLAQANQLPQGVLQLLG